MSELDSTNAQEIVEYRPIAGFPGYRVGDDGSVWSSWTRTVGGRHIGGLWRRLKPRVARGTRPTGTPRIPYCHVILFREERRYFKAIHTIVLEAFVGARPAGMESRHLDGNALNNSRRNLEWATKSVNAQDKHAHGTSQIGERSSMSIITEEDVRAMRAMRLTGMTYQAIADVFGVSLGCAYHATVGTNWRHVT